MYRNRISCHLCDGLNDSELLSICSTCLTSYMMQQKEKKKIIYGLK